MLAAGMRTCYTEKEMSVRTGGRGGMLVSDTMRENTEGFRLVGALIDETERVILGKRGAIEQVVTALLAGGHVLIEDVPGTGKTTLATAIARAAGLSCTRAQFTPDVMASDITGFTIYNKAADRFEYRPGLVMCNILLADEINRTSPKTQSALLEAMEEGCVTVDGETHKLPEPFMVIATQNEHGYVGTFPLPEAQLDRFLIRVKLGYPSAEEEADIISQRKMFNPLEAISPVLTRKEVLLLREAVRRVHIEDSLYDYIVRLVRATREHPAVMLGCSPRASLSLMRASQAHAFIAGRSYVTPSDVQELFHAVAAHRILISQEAKLRRVSSGQVVREALERETVPLTGRKRA